MFVLILRPEFEQLLPRNWFVGSQKMNTMQSSEFYHLLVFSKWTFHEPTGAPVQMCMVAVLYGEHQSLSNGWYDLSCFAEQSYICEMTPTTGKLKCKYVESNWNKEN